MSEYKVSEIFVYPVKSLGGISLQEAEVTDRGFKYDRRWMLLDRNGVFLSQRNTPEMALLGTSLTDDSLLVFSKFNTEQVIRIPLGLLDNSNSELFNTYMWDDNSIQVVECDKQYSDWFSKILKTNCKFVCMPSNSIRKVDPKYASDNEITSLSDGYPFLIIGEESLNLLNSKLNEPLPMNRFRPNIVFTGGTPHDEDDFDTFEIGSVTFKRVKPCARCTITTVNQDTGERMQEPLQTLSTYRKAKNKVMFGQNLLHFGEGIIRVGDEIKPVSK